VNLQVKNMTIHENIQEQSWLAVQRFIENDGAVERGRINQVFSSNEELSGLMTLLGGGYVLQSSDRFWLNPDLCVALIRQGAVA